MRSTYKIFVVGLEGKRPCMSHGHRWEDNFKMDLRSCGLDSTDSGYDPVIGFCVCGDVLLGSIKAGNSWPAELLSAFQGKLCTM
jgi:hypothetical protein